MGCHLIVHRHVMQHVMLMSFVTALRTQSYTPCAAVIHQNSSCSCEGLRLIAHDAFRFQWLMMMMC